MNERPTVISVHDLLEGVSKMRPGVGFDGIHANHLKFIDYENLAFISDFFNTTS